MRVHGGGGDQSCLRYKGYSVLTILITPPSVILLVKWGLSSHGLTPISYPYAGKQTLEYERGYMVNGFDSICGRFINNKS